MPQHFLGRRLADRTGDGNDFCPRALTRSLPQTAERRQHVLDDDHRYRQAAESGKPRFADDEQRGAVRHRHRRIVVTVDTVAFDCKKGLAGTDRTAVDGNAGDAFGRRAERAPRHRCDHVFGRPEPAQDFSSSKALRTSA